MSIRLTRRTGWGGSALRFSVFLDGEKVDKIVEGETKEIELPRERSVLKVTQLGSRSNQLEVKEGQKVEITTKVWARFFPLLPALIIFLIRLLDNLLVGVLLLVLFVLPLYLFEIYELKLLPDIPSK